MKALAALALMAAPALAEGPPPEYFTGSFERVGRTGEAPPALLNDRVRLDPLPDGTGIALTSCDSPTEAALALRFDRFGDVPNLLSGTDGAFEVWCQHFNDAGNYPILVCGSDMGALFTLVARPDAPDCPAP